MLSIRKITAAVTAAAALTVTAGSAVEASSSETTLADVLLADSDKDNRNGFDRRFWDYDIVTEAVLLFDDLVDAASDPDAELTAFLPNDLAFRRLVYELTGRWYWSEQRVFEQVAALGADTVKDVLLYHLVPAKISYRDALRADGAVLDTLLPDADLTVDVRGIFFKRVVLQDLDTNDRDARVVRPNLGGEAANGFAHGINRVLRPVDLP
jgi:hypothetical protein